jgi:hypothetical protein
MDFPQFLNKGSSKTPQKTWGSPCQKFRISSLRSASRTNTAAWALKKSILPALAASSIECSASGAAPELDGGGGVLPAKPREPLSTLHAVSRVSPVPKGRVGATAPGPFFLRQGVAGRLCGTAWRAYELAVRGSFLPVSSTISDTDTTLY